MRSVLVVLRCKKRARACGRVDDLVNFWKRPGVRGRAIQISKPRGRALSRCKLAARGGSRGPGGMRRADIPNPKRMRVQAIRVRSVSRRRACGGMRTAGGRRWWREEEERVESGRGLRRSRGWNLCGAEPAAKSGEGDLRCGRVKYDRSLARRVAMHPPPPSRSSPELPRLARGACPNAAPAGPLCAREDGGSPCCGPRRDRVRLGRGEGRQRAGGGSGAG